MQSSSFDLMASLIVIKNLQCPLGCALDLNQSVAEANDCVNDAADIEGFDPMERVYLVYDDKELVGWVSYDCFEAGKMLSDIAIEQISPSSVLSADTTALEAVQIFATSKMHFFFVLDHSQITGTFMYNDLYFGLPFKLCLFALTLSLEDNALRLLLKNPKESWEALSPNRRKKAVKEYKKRFGNDPEARKPPLGDLLRCTMFCDKGTILKKRKDLPGTSGKKVESIFRRAEKVRNDCAHTSPDLETAVLDRHKLYQFIRDVKETIEAIHSTVRE